MKIAMRKYNTKFVDYLSNDSRLNSESKRIFFNIFMIKKFHIYF